jgi:hypothetical protein
LVQAVDFFGELLDNNVLLPHLLPAGDVFLDKSVDSLLQHVDFRELSTEGIKLGVEGSEGILHCYIASRRGGGGKG